MKKNLDPALYECLINACCSGFGRLRIAVVGDLMLDHYLYGSVCRISPEAPVPIVKIDHEASLLGGAGNVAHNLRELGIQVSLISAVGRDRSGEILMGLPEIQNIDTTGILISEKRITTVKERVLGERNQQLLRLDYEKKQSLEPTEHDAVIGDFRTQLSRGIDCVIISDYGKGFCSASLCREIIEACRQKDIAVFVDPKGKNWEQYAGAYMITPNLQELRDVSGRDVQNCDEDVVPAAEELLGRFDLENILVTRSEQGATLINRNEVLHQKCTEREVYDVSGAGDTMISTFAAFTTAGVPLHAGIFAANTAAQIVIQKSGTSAVTTADIAAAIEAESHLSRVDLSGKRRTKLLSREEAAHLTRRWKTQGERVVFTNGCFDILHTGHIDLIGASRALGDRLIVAVNSDASVRNLKGEMRPVNTVMDRVKMLEAIADVDAIVIFEEETPRELLLSLCPNILTKGGDYRLEEIEGRKYVDEVVIIPLTKGYSTTSVIQRLGKRDMESC